MISFANPQYLYLLLTIPVIVILYFMTRISRRKKLSRFGNISVIRSLMPEASRYTGWIKLSIELLALALIIIAIARPVVPSKIESTEQESTKGIEVMICLDVSNSMMASSTDDPNGVSRLQRAKFILEKMIDKMNNDKVGLIVFAGESYTQLPITSDYISAKMFLNDLSTDMVPTQGTAIGAAIDMAMTSFTPDSDCDKAIIIITDGENFEDDAVAESARAASAGIQVDVIGVGSGNGAPIPVKGKRGQYMLDQNGAPVVTKLDQETASEIAKAGKGVYLSGASPSVVNELNDQLSKLKKAEYQRLTSSPAAELFPVFAIIALLLLMIDTIIPYRKISWLRGINFFTKTSRVIAIIIMSTATLPMFAADENKPSATNRYERNYIADGNKLYKEKRFAEAEVMYKKALEANPGSEAAMFNLAAAYIRQAGSADPNAGNNPIAQAQQMLSKLAKEATDQSIAELSYYNLGNLAFNQENYQQSIDQYKNALRRNPDNDKARENLRLAQLRLQDQQNDDKNRDQNKDDENQNQDQQQQNQQNQNQNNNNDNKDKDQDQQQQQQQKDKQQPQKQNQGMSDANADQILKAMENEEAATRRRVEAERRKGQEVRRKKVTNPW